MLAPLVCSRNNDAVSETSFAFFSSKLFTRSREKRIYFRFLQIMTGIKKFALGKAVEKVQDTDLGRLLLEYKII